MKRRACIFGLLLALSGMPGCHAVTPRIVPLADDLRLDAVWLGLTRDDLPGAERAAAALELPALAERARLDLLAAREGRPAALLACLQAGSWLAARYDASDERAQERLRARRGAVGDDGVTWLERARRSGEPAPRIAAARAALALPPGAAEGLAVLGETLFAQQRHAELDELLAGAEPATARLRQLLRREQAATGRGQAATEGLLADLRDGLGTPASLALLQELLVRVPRRALEAEALALLEHGDAPGARMRRAQDQLLATLLARAGRAAEAAALLAALDPSAPADDALLLACGDRVAAGEAPPDLAPLERRIANDPERVAAPALRQRRLADEWDLAARESYADADDGEGPDLDGFLARLDAASATIPGCPSLLSLPRQEFGVFGTLLDVEGLREALPDALLLGGKALTQPAELTWFDRVACEPVALGDGLGSYEQCLVRRARVHGYVASHGVSIAGAGLGRTVYLDLDAIEREERQGPSAPPAADPSPLPAHGSAERLDLAEPLDVAERLDRLSRAAAGDGYGARLLDALARHERQHIVDFQRFVALGAGGQLWTLLGAGLLPGAVRAAIERRAQLQ
ncbi:MAG TPA: hypothetical protein VK824_00035, partial [Planctomycetota bacterium]|nr:hypothetical protein [Planctomycetota bacterium]